MNCKLMK